MAVDRWEPKDSEERRERIKDADTRLEAWAKWASHQAGGGGASSSNWFMALGPPAPEDQQAGAKHVAEVCPDDEAMEVDAIIAGWKVSEPWFWKVVRKEYRTYGTQESKARSMGLNRPFYRQQLDELRLALWRALDVAARKSKNAGKLVEVPAKNARG